MAHQAVDTDTDPLCAYCSSLFNFDRMPIRFPEEEHKWLGERTSGNYEESAPHCILCYQITFILSYRPDVAKSKTISAWSYLSPDVPVTLGVIFTVEKPDYKQLAHYQSNHVTGQYLPRGEQSETQPCLDHLTRCLRECLSQHDECVPKDKTSWLPTRLLDTHPNNHKNDIIRLVDRDTVNLTENNGTNKQYLTLSHVWGNVGEHTLKLTQSNYASMKEKIDVSALPLCFRDAVILTRHLQKRYLWIDSLCIIQDSESDWAKEASNMGKVFRNSTCTIAATQSRSSNESMIVKVDPRGIQSICTTINAGGHISNVNLTFDWKGVVSDSSPLFKRGWVTQEMWLSPRVIDMCKYPFWECSKGVSSNVRTQMDNFSSRKNIEAAFQRDRAVNCWYRLITEYSKTSVTYPSDRLVAIGGLAQIFTLSGINEDYFAGIWGGTSLTNGLMWGSKSNILSRPSEYRAPSWSWASADGPVWFDDYSQNNFRLTYKLVSINTSPVTDDKFGQIKAGELIIRGFLFKIPKASHLSIMDEVALFNVNLFTFVERAYFLPIVWIKHVKKTEGLVLRLDGQQPSGEKYQIFTRIGRSAVEDQEFSCTGVLGDPGEWPCISWPKEREQVIVIV